VRRHAAWCGTLDELAERADVVVLALPIQAIPDVLRSLARCAPSRRRRTRLLVCDTATVKEPAIRAASQFRRQFDFVGLHPFAGRERNGWEASDPALFRGRPWVVCANPGRPRSVSRELISLVGGSPMVMDARVHDRIIAETIGLPHALAFAAEGSVVAATNDHGLRGNSWASLTRVAVSDADMVAGFLHANAANQLVALARVRRNLERVERALRRPTPHEILRLLTRWQARAAAARSHG
jgi:prephenate dehydrogenase